jgi:trehalose synthase
MQLEFFESKAVPIRTQIFEQYCPETWNQVKTLAERLKRRRPDFRLIHITHPYRGTGVAEMLPYLGGMLQHLGISFQWWIAAAPLDFHTGVQSLLRALQGESDPESLTSRDREMFSKIEGAALAPLSPILKPGDAVVFHDPFTLPFLKAALSITPLVLWRCHLGNEFKNASTRLAWRFMQPYLDQPLFQYVFTRKNFAPDYISADRLMTAHPVIHPYSWKNMELRRDDLENLYQFMRGGKQPVEIQDGPHLAKVSEKVNTTGSPPEHPEEYRILTQIGWWNAVKDPLGTFSVFAQHHERFPENTLLFLVGPRLKDNPQNTEALTIWHTLLERYKSLPLKIQQKIIFWRLPIHDRIQNALYVNTLQRLSSVILQKSLQEGFGLTVTEGMWKSKAVIGSAVGGLQDQIIHEETGLLLKDPRNHEEAAQAIQRVLKDTELRNKLGRQAKTYVTQHFLLPHLLEKYLNLFCSHLE